MKSSGRRRRGEGGAGSVGVVGRWRAGSGHSGRVGDVGGGAGVGRPRLSCIVIDSKSVIITNFPRLQVFAVQ